MYGDKRSFKEKFKDSLAESLGFTIAMALSFMTAGLVVIGVTFIIVKIVA